LLLLSGVESVGVFAIGVSLAEAIWIFSRSISLVQYSNVLQTGDTVKSRKETGKVSLISFLATAACIAIVAVLPANIFSQIFNGEEFSYVKNIIILLSPGILAIAISNVYGNFFSAIGKLNILILKSAAGVVVTLILSLFLISEWGIAGACIVNSSAYIVSSVILFVAFFYKKPLITSHKSL
ncbi:MAG: polysaccharide biosynthesis C-terminal domain-containing protein, partial [Firmicutes bacterium]|nr:polysaccharide biosynthesis C-terminal domain-containing protein [Bacillota bacterium]